MKFEQSYEESSAYSLFLFAVRTQVTRDYYEKVKNFFQFY